MLSEFSLNIVFIIEHQLAAIEQKTIRLQFFSGGGFLFARKLVQLLNQASVF